MSKVKVRCEQVRRLIPLRVSNDLTVDECAHVDQHVRYCPACQKELDAQKESLLVLREAGLAPLAALAERSRSLWPRIEPRLGPAGRMVRRPFDFISTQQLAAACLALVALTAYVETQPLGRQANRRMVGPAAVVTPVENQWLVPTLGITAHPITSSFRHLGPAGALVVRVLPDSPASQAGVAVGDVVLAVDGVAVDSPDQLGRLIRQHTVGEMVRLTVRTNGQTVDREVLVGGRATGLQRTNQGGQSPDDGRDWLLPGNRDFAPEQLPSTVC